MDGRIVLPGGSGFLGRSLARYFAAQGRDLVILSRREAPAAPGIRTIRWDGTALGDWRRELDGAAAVVNLAGRSVNCRYDERHRREIYDSRLRSTAVLGEAMAGCAAPPPVWINSSSATIYRDARDRPMDEATGEHGTGFSVDVCERWEETFFSAPTPATRRVALRSPLVLGRGDGVMAAFERIVRLGLGGTLGRGDQRVSWVHVEDFVRSVEWLLEHPLEGPVNCAAPGPVTNREFMAALRRAYHQPVGLPAAEWMLEIGAFFLRTETELLLKSRWVLPKRLLESGFRFRYPDLPSALAQIVTN
jgi:uncharacterized protein (TIGR01777 family)